MKPILIDEYGKISISEENKRLNKLSDKSQSYPNVIFFISKSFTRNISKTAAYRNLHRILNYLESRGIERDRIIFGATYDKQQLTRIFIVPPGGERPEFEDEILDVAKLTERLKSSKSKTKKSGN